ncbi:MAG: glutathione S-transferase N-terminal domain-containing protein, partial [Gammaproteobacteria bacterium]
MKLYYAPGACSLAPHIVACEIGLNLELVKVDLQTKQTENGDDYRLINPDGYVPALVLDDGRQLTESPVIAQYLADLAPEKHLLPEASTFERYRVQQWLNFISSEIHKSFSPLFNPNAHDAIKQAATELLSRRLDTVADRLAGGGFLTGAVFTAA